MADGARPKADVVYLGAEPQAVAPPSARPHAHVARETVDKRAAPFSQCAQVGRDKIQAWQAAPARAALKVLLTRRSVRAASAIIETHATTEANRDWL